MTANFAGGVNCEARAGVGGVTANFRGVTANFRGVTANFAGVTANLAGVTVNFAGGVTLNFSDVTRNFAEAPPKAEFKAKSRTAQISGHTPKTVIFRSEIATN